MLDTPPARRHIERLAGFVGTWQGTGSARFPTIETAEYREELRFEWNATEAWLHFEQRTWWKVEEPWSKATGYTTRSR